MKARARQALPAAGVRANVEALTPAPLPGGEGWDQLGASTDRGPRSRKIPSPLGRGWLAAPSERLTAPRLAPSSSRAQASDTLTPAPLPVGEGCKVEIARCTLPLIPSPPGRGWRAAPGEGLTAPRLASSSSRARASDALAPAPLPGGEGCKVESARCALPLIHSPPVRCWRAAPGEGLLAPRLAPSSSRARGWSQTRR